jgi:hypothetical protein
MRFSRSFGKYLRAGFTVAAMFALAAFLDQPAENTAARKAIVVELFTSEGCSSCPPADELLSRLRQARAFQGAEIIPLGFHVDYWNFQGWRDRFSSADYSRRQQQYAQKLRLEGPYTPQMVVDGVTQFVGNDAARAQQAIAQAALLPQSAQIDLSFVQEKVLVHVTAPELPSGNDVLLAVTEDNLVNKVSAGENDGRELRHSAVVRELRRLGQLHNGSFEATASLKPARDWKPQDLRVVVFVQETASGKIQGAASAAATSLAGGR